MAGGAAPADDKPFDDAGFDAGIEVDEESDPKKYIQKLSGKLGQSLRQFTTDTGQPDLELEKFAINSVVSASHTADMSPEDKDDIIKKINKSGQEPAPEEGGAEAPAEDPMAEPEQEMPTEGIQILPKEHKQVFKDAKLGVTEAKKSGIFADKMLTETETQPQTKPVTTPDTAPTRRSKPWRIAPQPAPQPKALEEDGDTSEIQEGEILSIIKLTTGYAELVVNIGGRPMEMYFENTTERFEGGSAYDSVDSPDGKEYYFIAPVHYTADEVWEIDNGRVYEK